MQRWNSATRNAVSIAQPRMIRSYNKHMGGVDLLDRFLSDYRSQLRSKKWWWCLFANFLNMSVVAAWRLHKELKGIMSHIQFEHCLAKHVIKRLDLVRAECGIRFGRVFHACEPATKQGRCKQCKKIPHT